MRPRSFALSLLLSSALACTSAAYGQQDAQAVLTQAEHTAAREGKNILVTFGASWCSNCHLLDKMLDDPKVGPILDRAFVHIDLTTGEQPNDQHHSNTPGGIELQDRLGGKQAGWPYFAMLDSRGKLLVDSFRPDKGKPHAENVGYPATTEEIDWFNHMLQVAAPNVSAADRATVQSWLKQHSPVH